MTNFIKKHYSIIITFIVTFFIAAGIFILVKGYQAETTAELIKDLCDSFSVSGLMLIFMGLLIFVGNDGFFSILSYGFKMIFQAVKKDPRMERFHEYKRRRVENPSPYVHLLIVGAIYLAIGLIFLAIFYVV